MNWDETYRPDTTSPNKDHHESVTTHRHAPCKNCGRAAHAHDRIRVYPDDGPPGSFHWELRCPE